MNRSAPPRSRTLPLLTRAAAGFAALSTGEKLMAYTAASRTPGVPMERPAGLGRYLFSRDHIIGTSLDLELDAGRPDDAVRAEAAILTEIDRLNRILSTYDPDSEISRYAAGGSLHSEELAALLTAYRHWNALTGGLIDANLGKVIALWKSAARTGAWPEPAELAAAAAAPRAFNVDALGKGMVIDRAIAVARRFVPAGLLNLGGDIRVWGDRDWVVGIADPAAPADNAPPLATVTLREAAIATSAAYARPHLIAGRRFSHLIDPRTLQPLPYGGSATFIAADALTANALSTAAVVVGTSGTPRLLNLAPVSGSLVVDPNGTLAASGSIAPLVRPTAATVDSAADSAWPAGNQVTITLALKNFGGGGFGGGFGGFDGGFGPGGRGGRGGRGGAKRPYVAVWIEDGNGALVRNLTLWASEGRYIPELTTWWSKISGNWSSVQAVSRATRPPGTYKLTWDGKDAAGNPVPTGNYTVFVEINREHGSHVVQRAEIACGTEPAEIELKATSESDTSTVDYGPKEP